MVSAVTFREPALLVKAVTTLDVLSGGRAWPGIGAGYQHEGAAALGLAMPPTAEQSNDSAKRCASRWPCGPATSGPSKAWPITPTSSGTGCGGGNGRRSGGMSASSLRLRLSSCSARSSGTWRAVRLARGETGEAGGRGSSLAPSLLGPGA
jgi:hypothetical protein